MTSTPPASIGSLSRVPALVLLLLVGCSRALPDAPAHSPIDPEGPAPEPITVDVALRSDPPLPGESREGWPGLAEPKPSSAHHGHHGHHAKPAKPESEPKPSEGGEHDH
jgi:hypothetical protein